MFSRPPLAIEVFLHFLELLFPFLSSQQLQPANMFLPALRSASLRSTRPIQSRNLITSLGSTPSYSRFNISASFSTSSRSLAANPQSGKPASDNFAHTVKNIKEEAGQVAASLESAVAGQPGSGAKQDASGVSEILQDAKSITGEMAQKVPQPALLWGAAGELNQVDRL